MEKLSNIDINDLFSQCKKTKEISEGKITRDEKNAFLAKKKALIDNLSDSFKMNDEKNKILEEVSKLNYKIENLNKGILIGMTVIMMIILLFLLIGIAAILTTLVLGLILFHDFQKDMPSFIVWWLISFLAASLLIVDIKKNKYSLKNYIDDKIILSQKKISNFFTKFLKNNGKETFEYINTDIKVALYYENKTGNELYDKFLLEEITMISENGASFDYPKFVLNSLKNKVILQANKKFEKYIEEKKELEFIEKITK